jgi:ketol-acid reductoisomerase
MALNLVSGGLTGRGVAARSRSAAKAEAAGIKVMDVPEAAKWADVVMILTPDELQGGIWEKDLKPNMRQGMALFFAHGLNIHFNLIEPRPDMDICMVAPKGPGHTVRAEYARGAGVPCLMAIAQDATGNAHDLTLSYAAAIGGGRAGISRRASAGGGTDLFSEQSVLCGGLVELMRNGYETLAAATLGDGLFQCVHR